MRKAEKSNFSITLPIDGVELHKVEIDLINLLYIYSEKVAEAGSNYSPALIAQYVYDLAKTFNSFYAELSVLGEENVEIKQTRVILSRAVARTIFHAMALLGISVPDRM